MHSAARARRPPPGRHSQSGRRRFRRRRALWIGLRRQARRCWAGLRAGQGGADPALSSAARRAAFCHRHAARRTDRPASHLDRSNFPRDSLSAPRIRSQKILPPKASPAPFAMIVHGEKQRHERLLPTAVQQPLYRHARSGYSAPARGEPRADEFAAGYGGIPARGVSGSTKAAAIAALEETLLAPAPGLARDGIHTGEYAKPRRF